MEFTPSQPEIEAELERILRSRGFAAAERLSRLLRFTVEQAMAGGENRLKEYHLGVALFERPDDFDPRIDPIVRVEVSRLRARLKEYYEGEGREDPIFIEYPRRSYAPVFRQPHREEAAEAAVPVESSAVAAPGGRRLPVFWWWVGAGVAALAAVVLVIWGLRRSAPAPNKDPSVAVLPFVDLSPGHDQEYLSDGLTEEIINALSKVAGLRVVARTSTFAFKGRAVDVREIARRLDVSAVIEGSLRKDGERLRVTAQLINGPDGYHLWSETYEVRSTSVFQLQDDISRAIANTLGQRLGRRAGAAVASAVPVNSDAYHYYLKGRYFWNRRTQDNFQKALEYFEKAVETEPGYARAWAGVADCWASFGGYGARPPNEVMPRARAAAEKALALDDTLAEAHTSLGYIRATYEWDWAGAEAEFRRAIELNPNYATAHQWYAVSVLYPQNRLPEAIRETRFAQQNDPLSLIVNTAVGLMSFMSRDYTAAVKQYHRVLEMDPDFYMGERSLGIALLVQGDLPAAIKSLERARMLSNGQPGVLGELGRAYGEAHREAEARRILGLLMAERAQNYVSPETIAQCHIGLGDIDAAFEWLSRAVDEHAGTIAGLAMDPLYDGLRGDARFVALLRRIHLVK